MPGYNSDGLTKAMPAEEVREILYWRMKLLERWSLFVRLPTCIRGMIFSYEPFSTYFGMRMHEWQCGVLERFIFWPQRRRQSRMSCQPSGAQYHRSSSSSSGSSSSSSSSSLEAAIRDLREQLDGILHTALEAAAARPRLLRSANTHEALLEAAAARGEHLIDANYLALHEQCKFCGQSSHLLYKCLRCKSVYYCDDHCQRKGWEEHKAVCRAKAN